MIDEIVSKVKHRLKDIFITKNYLVSLSQKKSKISFSQSGEDLIIDYIFTLRGVINPFYIDVGAHHPFYLNNTALFYLKGCKGVNIEANPNLIKSFFQHRSKDLNLNYALGLVDEEELDFYILSDSTLSTFAKIEMENCTKNNEYSLVDVMKIKTYTFMYLFHEYFEVHKTPDLMSIDIEGLDYDIIQSIDFSVFRPKVICLESHNYSPTGAGELRYDMLDYMISKNYHEYANTGLNSIFVDKEFWFL